MTQGIIALIRFYRWAISPFKSPRCRFEPTCSQYALYALQFHGLRKGLWLTIKRLFRCHPIKPLGGSWGFDPVPSVTTREMNS